MLVTSGSQLIAPFTGSPSSALNLSTNVSPNALLGSGSYPLPSDTGTGPLTTVPAPTLSSFLRMQDTAEGDTILRGLWTSPTAAYVYSNSPSNLGGIVGAGGAVIDGFTYAAGTYVFQFMDFTQAATGLEFFEDYAPTVFRGCRGRAILAPPGLVNMGSSDVLVAAHYCDLGWPSAADVVASSDTGTILGFGTGSGGCRIYRCYFSYQTTAIQPNVTAGVCDVIENYVEKLTWANLAHLNGITYNGGNLNTLCLRNRIVVDATDENGNAVNQTDCISMFQDFGGYPGTGTNTDGSTGYFLQNNYVGGTGYCFYLGAGGNPITNLTFTGNLITTSAYSTGGYYGPTAAVPQWGWNGNTEYSNFWADGSLASEADLFGTMITTIDDEVSGVILDEASGLILDETVSISVTAGIATGTGTVQQVSGHGRRGSHGRRRRVRGHGHRVQRDGHGHRVSERDRHAVRLRGRRPRSVDELHGRGRPVRGHGDGGGGHGSRCRHCPGHHRRQSRRCPVRRRLRCRRRRRRDRRAGSGDSAGQCHCGRLGDRQRHPLRGLGHVPRTHRPAGPGHARGPVRLCERRRHRGGTAGPDGHCHPLRGRGHVPRAHRGRRRRACPVLAAVTATFPAAGVRTGQTLFPATVTVTAVFPSAAVAKQVTYGRAQAGAGTIAHMTGGHLVG